MSLVPTIVFDAVGTLIYPDPPVVDVYSRVGRKYGSRLSEVEVRDRFHRVFGEEYSATAPANEDQERAVWRQIVERVFEKNDCADCFEELFSHFGIADAWKCFPDVPRTLSELSQRGYSLGLASNFDRRLHAIIRGHSVLQCLSPCVISSEIGVRKPHREFYHELAKAAGREPGQILMVGDSWENDVLGAIDAGLEAVYLDRKPAENRPAFPQVPVIRALDELLGLLP